MSNVFDNRVLTGTEQAKLKKTIEDGVKYLEAIHLEKESLKDLVADVVKELNDGIDQPEQKIKGAVINKMMRAVHRRNLQDAKDKVAEVEDGLAAIGTVA